MNMVTMAVISTSTVQSPIEGTKYYGMVYTGL